MLGERISPFKKGMRKKSTSTPRPQRLIAKIGLNLSQKAYMAGSRHHVIPRFLQKGFASRIEDKKVFTYQYRKGLEPAERSTKDLGVERHFYGRNGEPNVDDKITLLEDLYYVPLLERLRAKSSQTGVVLVDEPLVADFISHLCTRTKNFRESFYQSMDYCIAAIDNYFSDFSKIKSFLIKYPAKTEDLIKLKAALASSPEILDSKKIELESFFQSLFIFIKSELPVWLNKAIIIH
jgi:hypothetical protein